MDVAAFPTVISDLCVTLVDRCTVATVSRDDGSDNKIIGAVCSICVHPHTSKKKGKEKKGIHVEKKAHPVATSTVLYVEMGARP